MPSIQRETALAAGVNSDNLWAGSAYEFMRQNGVVSAACVASATGGFITIQAGPDVALEESPPTIKATMPTVPDDFLYTFAAAAGDRLVCRARNPTGGALTFRTVAQITYV